MTQIAFLGTGLLGSGFVEAAAKRGGQITVWNRTKDKARALEQFGVRVADSPADAVRGARRVHLVLRDDAVVEDVIASLRTGLSNDAIIIDHTTTQPALTAERARRLSGEGVQYIHCPVFIGPVAARAGQGTILSSGPRALFDAIHGELAKMAQRVEYLGERADLAAVIKLCGNAYIIGVAGVVSDVLSVASGSNVDAADALRTLELFESGNVARARGKRMVDKSYSATFELTMARKDVRLMLETADGRPLATLPGIGARMDTLIESGHGADDLAGIGRDAVA